MGDEEQAPDPTGNPFPPPPPPQPCAEEKPIEKIVDEIIPPTEEA